MYVFLKKYLTPCYYMYLCSDKSMCDALGILFPLF